MPHSQVSFVLLVDSGAVASVLLIGELIRCCLLLRPQLVFTVPGSIDFTAELNFSLTVDLELVFQAKVGVFRVGSLLFFLPRPRDPSSLCACAGTPLSLHLCSLEILLVQPSPSQLTLIHVDCPSTSSHDLQDLLGLGLGPFASGLERLRVFLVLGPYS